MVGLYVAGWAKRGPVGIIDSTLRDTIDTFRMIKHHLDTDQLSKKTTDINEIIKFLE
jgi:NADPH-dependent glutamate synthase beta subunit-like oxidoreductase